MAPLNIPTPPRRGSSHIPALAVSPNSVSDAIHRFADEVRRSRQLAGRLSYVRAWYAEQDENGRWWFGPSKFVGYEGLDAATYVELWNTGLDGRKTEAHLQRWFREIDSSSGLYGHLNSELSAFLALYDKAPNRKKRINVSNVAHAAHPDVRRDGWVLR